MERAVEPRGQGRPKAFCLLKTFSKITSKKAARAQKKRASYLANNLRSGLGKTLETNNGIAAMPFRPSRILAVVYSAVRVRVPSSYFPFRLYHRAFFRFNCASGSILRARFLYYGNLEGVLVSLPGRQGGLLSVQPRWARR